MENSALKVIEARDVQLDLPLEVVKKILSNEPHRLSTYIADPRQELNTTDLWQTFRDIKIDGVAVPFLLCLRCGEVLSVSPATAAWTMRNHVCHSISSDQERDLPRDETEMSELRRLMRSVTGSTGNFILEEARSCFQVSKWADVTLVSSSDSVAIKVHSLVLAAACPVLQAAMEDMVPSDQDEMTVIIPDTNREDLIMFANSLYNLDKTTTHFSSLLHLINFDSRNNVVVDNGDQVEDSKDYFEEEHMDDSATDDCSFQYSSEDIKNLISTNPKRVQYEDAAGMGKHTKVWKSYKQIRVDKKPVPFLSCRICGEIFLQSSTSSSTAIKRHAKTHTEDRQDVGMKEAPGQKDGGGTDALKKHQLQQGVRKDLKVSPGKRKTLEEGESEESPTWDESSIEKIKKELEAPSQRVKDAQSEAGAGGPGVSKFAISQLILADSDRVTFEESTTHSPVWEKFLKISLDSVEVPFVCCKYCKKVYTHDRTLGTSSLIRHQCSQDGGAEKARPGKTGNLPKLLVQELVNTKSARVSIKSLPDKFNARLEDVTSVFSRVLVDHKETEYISCNTCNKLYVLSASKLSHLIMKKIELHDCYIKSAPSISRVVEPETERDCWVILVREPERIKLRDKVKNEPHLHHFLLDGREVGFAHCTKCLRFFNISTLNMNEERIHRCHKVKTTDHIVKFKKKTPYQCDKCEEVFKSEHFLEIHKRKIHGEGSATVMCSHCGKEFPTERLAKKHELHVHYPELSKKFPCSECDATFHDRSKLKLHSMKHSSIKPYVCEQCGKGFNWQASFQDHMDMHSGVKKYTCEFCQRTFTKRNTLNNHRRLHTGEKPFICPAPGCGMTFVQRTACKTHAKKRHNIEITIYARNPEVPQSQASLAQMSVSQRMEQQQIQERLRQDQQQQQQQQQHEQQQQQQQQGTVPGVVMAGGGEGGVGPAIQLSRAQLAQLTGGVGQVVTVLQGPDGQFTQIRLLDHRDGVEVLGLDQR